MNGFQKHLKPIAYSFIGVGSALILSAGALLLAGTGVFGGPVGKNDQTSDETSWGQKPTLPVPESTEYPEGTDLCAVGVHYPVTVTGVKPTCFESGQSDKSVCEKCGFTLRGSTELPPIAHGNREVLEICLQNHMGFAYQALFHCPDCDQTFYNTLEPRDLHMPIINLKGNIGAIDGGTKKPMSVSYMGEGIAFDCDALMRFQGQSSLLLPKKNYSIQFYKTGTNYQTKQKVELFEGHKESKYCLKANYIDASQARNIVAARIYKQISETRDNGDPISQTDTQCVIDGYPVLLYINGNFNGLYTFNMPKDNWVFDMHKSPDLRQAALFSRHFEATNYLRTHLNFADSNWKMEFASTEDIPEIGTQWAVNSFNNMIDTLNTLSDAKLREVLPNVVNIDRTIDVVLYTTFLACYDNRTKNNLYLTYDGVQWAPVMYDMDAAFGLNFDGSGFYAPNFNAAYTVSGGNNLFQKVSRIYKNEMAARYRELRQSVLTYENIDAHFAEFFAGIPQVCYTADFAKNPGIPKKDVNSYGQIMGFVKERLAYLDSYFGK